jgi:hypothetical protein
MFETWSTVIWLVFTKLVWEKRVGRSEAKFLGLHEVKLFEKWAIAPLIVFSSDGPS